MHIAIYARKSKLTEKGESIKNQIESCKAYISLNYPENEITVYADEGYSGGNTNRPNFNILREKIKQNDIDILISYKLDRISRSISDFSDFVSMLDRHKTAYISVKEQFDTSSPMGRAMMYIIAVFAQLERETIAERITDNLTGLAATGRYLAGKAPVGFSKKQIKYIDENGAVKKYNILEENAEESAVVRLIFQKYGEFKSIEALKKYLALKGIKSRSGKPYSSMGIRRILTHPDYMSADEAAFNYFRQKGSNILSKIEDFDSSHGIAVLRRYGNAESKWLVSVGCHNWLISSQSWIKTQNILSRRTPLQSRPKSSYSLFSAILKCKSCKSPLRAMGKKKNGIFYYCCVQKEKGLCKSLNIRGDLTDRLAFEKIHKLLFNKKIFDEMLKKEIEKNKHNKIKNKPCGKDKEDTDDALAKIINEKEKLISDLVLKLSQIQENSVLQYIQKEIKSLDIEITELKKAKKPDSDIYNIFNAMPLDIDIYKSSEFDFFGFFLKTKKINELSKHLKKIILYAEASKNNNLTEIHITLGRTNK